MKTALIMLAAINVMTIGKYVVYPGWFELAFWLMASIPAFLHRRSVASSGRRSREGTMLIYTLILTGAYLVLWWVSGYVDGFGRSPYTRSLLGILRNFGLFGGTIVAQEYVRAYIVRCDNYGKCWMVIGAAFSFFAYSLNFVKMQTAFTSWGTFFQYTGGTLLPGVCTVVFLTWLSKIAGWLPPLIFRLAPEAVQWLLPALPKSSWQTNMMLGAAFIVFAMIIMQQLGIAEHRKNLKKIHRKKRTNPGTWVGLLATIALMFSFSLGLLPLRPMVIATGSMLPVIQPGDMVILQNMDTKSLKVGDVIAYQTEGYQIVHRIMTIQPSQEGNSYIMKGDNNESPDINAVRESQIVGKVVQIIPYVGLLSLSVQKIDSPQSVPVETGS